MSRNLFQYDPVIGYRFVPGLKGRVRHEGGGYLVRCNNAGFRSDHVFRDAPTPGKRRVLVFGDSNTAGDGVSNGKRFSDLIEAQLPDCEVYNFGLPSSGTDQQYLAFRECAGAMHYDLLLLCPMVDNIRRNLQDARLIHSGLSGELALLPKPYFDLAQGALVLRNVPVPKGHLPVDNAQADEPQIGSVRALARQAMSHANARFPGLRGWTQWLRRLALPAEYNSPNTLGWQLMRTILAQWIAEARAPVILAPIPTFEHIDGNIRAAPYRARFAELSRETGAALVDVLDGLRAQNATRPGSLRFPTDEHPTVAGHAAIAELLVPHVARALEGGLSNPMQMSAE
ncbi:MAG: SGNH/GDSL hydrolase family protein [Roseivivax sp.]|nr:SGNH/GDSL hydrolase family protein [Roseivivax sp.]